MDYEKLLNYLERKTADTHELQAASAIIGLRQRVAELEKERDELLAALEYAAACHVTEGNDSIEMATDPMWCYEQYEDAAKYIDMLENHRDELLAAKGKVSVTLTGKEIREIAELAGLQFVEHDYTDEYETEIAIESCPDKGILNDDNAPEHYRLIAFLNEYPEEGCIGLGEKIETAAIASVKGGQA